MGVSEGSGRHKASEVCEPGAFPPVEPEPGSFAPLPQLSLWHEVRIDADLSDDEAPAPFEDPVELGQRLLLVADLTEYAVEVSGVERGIVVREVPGRVSERRRDVVDAALVCPPHGGVEHFLLDVEDVEGPIWVHPLGHLDRVVP